MLGISRIRSEDFVQFWREYPLVLLGVPFPDANLGSAFRQSHALQRVLDCFVSQYLIGDLDRMEEDSIDLICRIPDRFVDDIEIAKLVTRVGILGDLYFRGRQPRARTVHLMQLVEEGSLFD